MDTTTIKVKVETHDLLRAQALPGECFDDVIRRMVGLAKIPRGKGGSVVSRQFAPLYHLRVGETIFLRYENRDTMRSIQAGIDRASVATGFIFEDSSAEGRRKVTRIA